MDNNSENESFGEVTERELPEDSSQDEQVDNDSGESQDNESEQTDDQGGEEGNEEGNQNGNQEPKRTEKGTKLDPNPKSAVHQQLANQIRVRSQMEQVLADPAKIARFVKEQYGIEMPVRGGTQQTQGDNQGQQPAPISGKKFTAKDFENIEDVANVVNTIQEQFTTQISQRDAKIEELTKQIGGIQQGGRVRQVADNLASDVTNLRSLPELDPKSSDFVEGLEEEIGNLYHRLDFDERAGMYRGNYSLQEIGESVIGAARKARKVGSQNAQTIVKDRNGGRVRTTQGGANQDNSNNVSPEKSIAAGIAKMFK